MAWPNHRQVNPCASPRDYARDPGAPEGETYEQMLMRRYPQPSLGFWEDSQGYWPESQPLDFSHITSHADPVAGTAGGLCAGTTTKGFPCMRPVKAGDTYCWQHA